MGKSKKLLKAEIKDILHNENFSADELKNILTYITCKAKHICRVTESNNTIIALREIPSYGDIFEVKDFAEMCKDGSLTSDDGTGYF